MKTIIDACCGVLVLWAVLAVSGAQTPPNIILILTDDTGYGEVLQDPKWAFPVDPLSPGGGTPMPRAYNAYPQPYLKTPNLLRFAQEGMRGFMSYQPASLCTPSRASILLGQGIGGRGVDDNDPNYQLTNKTFPMALKGKGYKTGYFGKWAVGTLQGGPWNHGFDYFIGQLTNDEAHCIFPPYIYQWNSSVNSVPQTNADVIGLHYRLPPNNRGVKFNTQNCPLNPQATCLFDNNIWRDALFHWLRNQSPTEPFFAFWAPSYPHLSIFNPTDPYNDHKAIATRIITRPANPNLTPLNRGHAGLIEAHMDGDMGLFLDLIKTLPLDSNTITIFTSDNGPPPEVEFFGANGGLRGGKTNLYEAGVRAPTIIRYPGVIPAGSSSRMPFALYELADVFSSLAALAPTKNTLLKAWMTQSEVQKRPPMLLKTCSSASGSFQCYSACYNLTDWTRNLWKIVTDPQGNSELFDLVADPTESSPITNMPNLFAAMLALQKSLDV